MTRILFVDDEPLVLDGLRRMLRAYRREWTMHFCEGPEEALATMAAEPFDVVVTDMRMPVMDGAELLTRVRELYPDTVRIVLSGQSEQEHVLRAVGPAHQYLSKPCDPESLRRTITRTTLLGKRINNPELKALVSRMDSLPSLPAIYYELVEVLQSPDASVDRVGGLIAQDISMTTKVLQMVNSSFFGLPVHVDSAEHAAALLGLNTLKPLVLTASIFRQLEESKVSSQFLERVITHSLSVAGLAKQLAKTEALSREQADSTFLAGALHDVGKIVLADNFGREYTGLIHQAQVQQKPLASIEFQELGVSHAAVGGFLLGLWGLPQEIVAAVAFHHDPQASGDETFSLLTAVHVGNGLIDCPSDPSLNDYATDEDHQGIDRIEALYLAQLGSSDRLPVWRDLAEQCAAPA